MNQNDNKLSLKYQLIIKTIVSGGDGVEEAVRKARNCSAGWALFDSFEISWDGANGKNSTISITLNVENHMAVCVARYFSPMTTGRGPYYDGSQDNTRFVREAYVKIGINNADDGLKRALAANMSLNLKQKCVQKLFSTALTKSLKMWVSGGARNQVMTMLR